MNIQESKKNNDMDDYELTFIKCVPQKIDVEDMDDEEFLDKC